MLEMGVETEMHRKGKAPPLKGSAPRGAHRQGAGDQKSLVSIGEG